MNDPVHANTSRAHLHRQLLSFVGTTCVEVCLEHSVVSYDVQAIDMLHLLEQPVRIRFHVNKLSVATDQAPSRDSKVENAQHESQAPNPRQPAVVGQRTHEFANASSHSEQCRACNRCTGTKTLFCKSANSVTFKLKSAISGVSGVDAAHMTLDDFGKRS